MRKEIKEILAFLKKTKNVDFTAYRPSMIERSITRRHSMTGCADHQSYLHYLHDHPEELDHLIKILTINVSRFFRNSLTFEYLEKIIIPRLITSKLESNQPALRIWSAACAFGEEPYSVAMIVDSYLEKENLDLKVEIFATDIDQSAISRARNAKYAFESVKNVKLKYIQKYFMIDNDQYILKPELTSRINFSVFDLLDKKGYAPPESVYGEFDIVFCKNVLIYFQNSAQHLVFEKIFRSIVKGGYLILGEVELPPPKFTGLVPENGDANIYQKI